MIGQCILTTIMKLQKFHPSPPANRKFGLLFSGIFAFLSAYAAYRGVDRIAVYCLIGAGVFTGLAAVAVPRKLTLFNVAWMKLGELMGRVVSPLFLGITFFVLITPVAMVSRLFGRDELRLKRNNTESYWINRIPPGPAGDSFKNQF